MMTKLAIVTVVVLLITCGVVVVVAESGEYDIVCWSESSKKVDKLVDVTECKPLENLGRAGWKGGCASWTEMVMGATVVTVNEEKQQVAECVQLMKLVSKSNRRDYMLVGDLCKYKYRDMLLRYGPMGSGSATVEEGRIIFRFYKAKEGSGIRYAFSCVSAELESTNMCSGLSSEQASAMNKHRYSGTVEDERFNYQYEIYENLKKEVGINDEALEAIADADVMNGKDEWQKREVTSKNRGKVNTVDVDAARKNRDEVHRRLKEVMSRYDEKLHTNMAATDPSYNAVWVEAGRAPGE